jgi:hypothetical protein
MSNSLFSAVKDREVVGKEAKMMVGVGEEQRKEVSSYKSGTFPYQFKH